MGLKINEFFDIVRPIIEFKFDSVLARSNNIFEVMTVEPIEALLKRTAGEAKEDDEDGDGGGMGDLNADEKDNCLHLKGQVSIF
jgi:hypothetical protein